MEFISGIKQIKHKALYFFAIILTISLTAHVENIWCAAEEETLASQISEILNKHKPSGSTVGISIFSISKNKSLYKTNSDELFIVASNMKLFTTATALIYLGPDFEYKTEIYYRGDIYNDKLNGDIIIKGCGDPNISGRFYEGNVTAVPTFWADAVKEHGIKIITGNIIADDSIFDREFICDSWPKDQLSRWYCAPVSGLSFNDNCIDIEISPNEKPGSLVHIQTEPDTSYVKINNNCKTTTSKSKHYSLERRLSTNIIDIEGYVWSKSKPQIQWITIHNPPLYTAAVFKEILENMDILVMGDARVIDTQDSNPENELHKLTETTSNLKQAVKVTNKRSHGFYAEHILKTLGAHVGKEGSFSAGLDVVREFITELGFSEEQYQIADGSGLSKKNKLTPGMIISLLRFMYGHKHAGVFMESLPISGIDGTLKKRLKEGPYRSRVKAKTGYVRGARTLSGYVKTSNDEIIAFSILVNKFRGSVWQAKRLQDEICKILIKS